MRLMPLMCGTEPPTAFLKLRMNRTRMIELANSRESHAGPTVHVMPVPAGLREALSSALGLDEEATPGSGRKLQ